MNSMPMRPCFKSNNHLHAFRTKRAFLLIGSSLLICPVVSSFAQTDPAQFIGRNSSRPQTVSRNQLLAPAKALRALERARKDINQGRLESAQKEIARALDIAPQYGTAKAVQGGIYLETKNYNAA